MKLRIQHGLADARDVKMVRAAVPEMLRTLLKPEQIALINLHITFTSLDAVYGDIELVKAPRFKIRLHDSLDPILLLMTLAHELIHLKQVMEGHLKVIKINDLHIWVWKNRQYGPDPYALKNASLPWETEAERKESALVRHFVKIYVTLLNGG